MHDPAPVPTAERLLDHADFLKRVARALVRDEHGAEDLVQETFARALVAPPDADGSIRGWLRTVARNLAASRGRGAARREAREAAVARREDLPSTDEILAREAVRHEVMEAVLGLPAGQREAVLLRYYEDLPAREIARRLECPVETVRTRLKRAHAALAGRLDQRHGGDRQAWLVALAPYAVQARRGVFLSAPVLAPTLMVLAVGTLVVALNVIEPKRDARSPAGGDDHGVAVGEVALEPRGESPADASGRRGVVPSSDASVSSEAAPEEADLAALRGLKDRLENYRGFGMGGEPPTGPGLRGRVLDASGAGASDAIVSLIGVERPEVHPWRFVGSDGRYYFGDLPSGRYRLRAFQVGLGGGERLVEHVAGSASLVPAVVVASPGVVEGVLSLPDGSPARELCVGAAHVADTGFELRRATTGWDAHAPGIDWATRPGGRGWGWAKTDVEGRFRITGLPAGEYVLRLVAPARFTTQEDARVRTGAGEVHATVESHRLWARASKPGGGALLATYRYWRWEAPSVAFVESAREAWERFEDLDAPADVEGYFYADRPLVVGAGDLVLIEATEEGFRPARAARVVGAEEWNARVAFELVPRADAEYGTLAVQVVGDTVEEARRSAPFNHELVSLATGERHRLERGQERYRVPAGRYRLRLEYPTRPDASWCFRPVEREVTVVAGEHRILELAPEPAGRVTLELAVPPPARFRSAVFDVTWRLMDRAEGAGWSYSVDALDELEELRLRPLLPGTYLVEVESERFAPASAAVEVRPHESVSVRVGLVAR